jgi:hypothetical protein
VTWRIVRAAALTSAFALPAAPGAALGVEDCRAIWVGHAGAMALAGLGERPPERIEVEGGACVARDLTADPFGAGRPLSYPRAVWTLGTADGGGAAFSLMLDVAPGGGAMPGHAATLRDRAELALSLTEEAAAGALVVALSIGFEGRNAVSAEVRALGLTAAGTAPLVARLASADIRGAAAQAVSDGQLAARWAALFPPPRAPGAADRAQAAALLSALPAATMSPAARDAALRILADWPDLRGRADLSLAAPQGLRPLALAALAAADPSRIAPALAGATLDARYGP